MSTISPMYPKKKSKLPYVILGLILLAGTYYVLTNNTKLPEFNCPNCPTCPTCPDCPGCPDCPECKECEECEVCQELPDYTIDLGYNGFDKIADNDYVKFEFEDGDNEYAKFNCVADGQKDKITAYGKVCEKSNDNIKVDWLTLVNENPSRNSEACNHYKNIFNGKYIKQRMGRSNTSTGRYFGGYKYNTKTKQYDRSCGRRPARTLNLKATFNKTETDQLFKLDNFPTTF